jgi:hypothetical protein
MGEVKISVGIEDFSMNIEEKIDYLRNKREFSTEDLIEKIESFLSDEKYEQLRDERKEVVRYYEDNLQELVELYEEHPEALEGEIFPNQTLYVTLTNTTPFSFEDFEEKEIKRAIEGVIFDKLGITGLIDKFEYASRVSENREKYYIELIVAEDKKEENRKRCEDISGILLLKEFRAQTAYGKVISFPIPHQLVDVFHRTSDFYVITSILDEASAYLCSSDLGRNVEEYLRKEEHVSLPQIDLSDYVNELREIVQSPSFKKICKNEYIFKVIDWLENMKKGSYEEPIYEVVEHILRNIARSVSVSGMTLQDFLDGLTKNDTNRRLLEETKCLIKALERNPRAHGRAKRPKWDEKYFALLSMKAIRDVYYNWYLFESLSMCLREVEKEPGRSFQDLWREHVEEIKRSGTSIEYEFRGDTIRFILNNLDYIFDVDLSKNSVREGLA